MSVDPGVRASDAEREHVAAVLRDHTAEGRLTLEEMSERMDATYAARTLGELRRLVADLPDTPTRPAARRTTPAGGEGRGRVAERLRARLATYGAVCLVCVVVWLATAVAAGQVTYFWPVWVIGPWGAAMLATALLAKGLGRSPCHRTAAGR